MRAVPEHAEGHAAALSGPAFRKLVATFAAYILFGAGDVSYITFVIALLRAQHLDAWVMVAFWLVPGMASALASLLWGSALGRLRGGHGMALVGAALGNRVRRQLHGWPDCGDGADAPGSVTPAAVGSSCG